MPAVQDVGDRYEFRVEFRDKAGALADPATITLSLEKPDGTIVGPWTFAGAEITRESIGLYAREHTFDLEGLWTAKWVSTGTPTTTEYEYVTVRLPKIPGSDRALIDLPYLKRRVRNTPDDDDQLLEDEILGWSVAVTNFTRREFLPKVPANDADPEVARTFKYDGSGFMSFETQEAREISAVRVDALGGAGFEDVDELIWQAAPVERTPEGTYHWMTFEHRWPKGRQGLIIEATGRWGIGYVPEDVKVATAIAVAHHYRNPENLQTRNVGEWDIGLETSDADPYAGALPRASRMLLLPYVRRRASVA